MKSVLTSIQPYFIFLIIAHKMGWNIPQEKTVEVRKNRPTDSSWDRTTKIYCSQKMESFNRIPAQYQPFMLKLRGKVIGEFVCDSIDTIAIYYEQIYAVEHFQKGILQQSCLTLEEVKTYLGSENMGYAWHISNLKIYDKPKKLGDFSRVCPGNYKCDTCKCRERKCYVEHQRQYDAPLKRPPLSWQYIETGRLL